MLHEASLSGVMKGAAANVVWCALVNVVWCVPPSPLVLFVVALPALGAVIILRRCQSHGSAILHASIESAFQAEPFGVDLLERSLTDSVAHHGPVLHHFGVRRSVPAFFR